jgi:hypothetical protein
MSSGAPCLRGSQPVWGPRGIDRDSLVSLPAQRISIMSATNGANVHPKTLDQARKPFNSIWSTRTLPLIASLRRAISLPHFIELLRDS